MIAETKTTIDRNTYDEVPYQSYPYKQSQPDALLTLGKLFGMNPPAIETARVLELGSAEGGNLIPHAVNYPNAKFVGVDLSKVQIDAGIANIKALGLKNIELKCMSIADIDKNFGEFDYIICHGVISWVPEFVRDKIFEICNVNLSENGIAYVSYNTLPGWNMIRTIRDMMLYHAKMFNNIQDKVTQARLLLKFITDSLANQNSPYADILRQETELLAQQSDHYLRHDHLEEDNKQFYFYEFMDKARENGLQYLSDVSLPSMYVGNMPKAAAEKLQEINDIVRTEQYMDFITNRRFRSTLLCKQSIILNRSLSNESVKNFALTMNVTPEKEMSEDILNSYEECKFYFGGNKDNFMTTSSPSMKAVLTIFSENALNPLKYSTLVKRASSMLKNVEESKVEIDLLQNAMNLVIKGYINLHSSENLNEVDLEKPKASTLAVHQATKTNNVWVTNLSHQAITLNAFDKLLIGNLDGTKNNDEIADLVIKEIKSGKLTIRKDDKVITDETELKTEVLAAVRSSVERFKKQLLLV